MHTNIFRYIVLLVVLLAMSSITAWGIDKYTNAELDELLGPIALYPDPLLAQIFPASTFLDQLNTASRFTGGTSAIDSQRWDVSVKAVAHYPEVLDMMVKNPDWTIAIGQAYVNQSADVLKSVQRLREKAELNGYLTSNAQQQVVTDNGTIAIVPAQPQYVYVPQYNPQVIYTEPAYDNYNDISPWITFGTGLLIGAWLNNSINWNNNNVYYHGWHGGGWVGHSRPYVNHRNNHYVNDRWNNRTAPVDRNINRRNIQPYRRDIQQNAGSYRPPTTRPGTQPAAGGRPTAPGMRPTQPGRPGQPGGNRPGTPNVPSTRPTQPGTPGVGGTRPGSPNVPSAQPAQPGRPGAGTQRPGMPNVPGAQPAQPGKPGAGTQRPGMPNVPGAQPAQPGRPGVGGQRPGMPNVPSAQPAQPGRPGAGTQRPGMPNIPSARPAQPGAPGYGGQRPGMPNVPGVRPAQPGGPGAGGYRPNMPNVPSARPSAPSVRPSAPTMRPSAPSVRPSYPTRPSGGYRPGPSTGTSHPSMGRPSGSAVGGVRGGGGGRGAGGGGRGGGRGGRGR